MRRRLICPLLFGMILAFVATRHAFAAEAIDAARIKEIAAMLPAQPAGIGRPISDRAAWKKLAQRPWTAETLKAAEAAAATEPANPDELYLDYSKTGNRDRWQKVAFAQRTRLTALVLAEGIENKGRFLPAIEKTIAAICKERTWVFSAHDGRLVNWNGTLVEIDLGAAMTAWDMATFSQILGDKLAPETRQLVSREVERRVLTPFRDMVQGRRGNAGWMTVTNNWNAVCLAGVTGAALATIEKPEDRALYVAAAEHYIRYFLKGFTPDGYCSEGLGYWNYGFGNFVMLAETVRQSTGGKLDLMALPQAAGPSMFALQSEIISDIYPSIADCAPGTLPSAPLVAYVSRRFGLGNPPAGFEKPSRVGYYTIFYEFLPADLPPVTSAKIKPTVGLRTWFADGGVLICRPDAAAGAFAACLKGGHNAEHHNHNDVGSFSVISGKTLLICDPGSEIYTARTFSGKRYDSDVLNSFGHAVPVVAGKLQRPGADARAKILRDEMTDAQDTLAMDIASAYPVPALKRLERTFTYRRGNAPSLVVRDDVEFAKPDGFETALVTWGKWEKLSETEFRISEGGDAIRVAIDTGGRPFEITDNVLEADVHTKTHAHRVGIALKSPVDKASVTLTITPAK